MSESHGNDWTDSTGSGIADRLDAFSAREVLRSALGRAPRSRRQRPRAMPNSASVIPTADVAAAHSYAARLDSAGRLGLPHAASATDPPEKILGCAEDLGIPWRRLLAEEIESEQKLRRYLSDVEAERPLRSFLKLLPFGCLRSWRVRDRIERLASAARGAASGDARRQLRTVLAELTGKSVSEKIAFAEHLWFAYQRILLLQRVRRAASRSRGTEDERMAFICSRARCSYDDAAWALLEERSRKYGDRFDAAVRKVREEGFRIPRAETEARSLAELRRLVRTSPYLRREHASRSLAKAQDVAARRA
ncbi:MAG TPA: hypothetical protein VF376_01630 [Thermoanaerobaculia bacterium]